MKTLLYKNTTISYSDSGTGNAIVLLHGFLENKKMWKDYVAFFSEKYRVITIDLLGHGESDPLGYVHEMEDNANVINEILEHLKIEKAIILGHSMGGYVGLAFAELYPQKIQKLVLLNSTSKEDSAEKKLNRTRAIKAVKQNYINFVSLAIANLFSENNRTRLAEEIEKAKIEALKTPLQGIIASLEGMKIRKDREWLLEQNRFPVLLILGKKDPVLSYEESLSQAENTSVQLVSFEDGHMSQIENKEELKPVLLQFFN
ncbi:alpha/beta fold hydrolase [Flavobacterium johnsoniae]|uniref:Peptidase family S33 n=1 Tax=Flavobacterium johnsoniae (strain ATCC 17061 / DSM 2064 / JCM 8514 / BCRC 14874 / CCUG 350202 / NBRC 14942 / NCIMB 11054 / UW101) TaxID=376686 RepID=A5FM35_FLAJ1|nr:alpha/beta hydrolase [Flavobacterium johnsoniae]ABQ03728.1 Peptidase family S33 [Flavobacterium johnsoniae UW101]OXG03251.1 alpha/beta hydrolase [Flavobacterium johnsoniae UW101]WQG79409.1 alpha/beta hydrolase [Flavobacterium johnsoniae UW101]SHK00963.1 Pimeloyl-ACP methyl ester carboxylesterase [Flavobacterium johnsoniae]